LCFHFLRHFQQLLKIIITVKWIVCQDLFSLFLYFSANAETLKIRWNEETQVLKLSG